MTLLDYIQTLLPACATFGPLFLVISGTSEKRTRTFRSAGAFMVGLALIVTWSVTNWQKGEISLLQQRIENLESRQ
jgi:hypothetical protein